MTGPAPEYMSKIVGEKEKNEKARHGLREIVSKTGYALGPVPREMT